MRHVLWRVLDEVGDGTATAAVIAQAVVREGTRHIAAGANPQTLCKGIDAALVEALRALERMTEPLPGRGALRAIALAAGRDEAVADRILELHERHGDDVVIVT